MAMQMIAAGGIEPLTDSLRTPDADNPRGYYEFERVKQLKTDKAWVGDAVGKVVKVIHMLLPELPEDREYRVVFMDRSLQEVVASQSAMLSRNAKSGASIPPERLKAVFEAQLKTVNSWLADRPQFKVLHVPHAEMIRDTVTQARAINEFLGGDLKLDAMLSAVDPSLHRNKS